MSIFRINHCSLVLGKWIPFFIITCTFIGSALGSFLFYFFQGEFPYEVLTGGLIATIINQALLQVEVSPAQIHD